MQREDGINVNLTFVSGVIHATACAQSGAAAITLPTAKVSFIIIFPAFFPSLLAQRARTQYCLRRKSAVYFCMQMGDWRRRIESGDADVEGGGEDAETIAAYFDLHGLSSSTGLIAGRMNDVRTFQAKRLFLTSFGLSLLLVCSSSTGQSPHSWGGRILPLAKSGENTLLNV